MIRALWFAVKLGVLVAAVVWVANRPGTVAIHWLGYDIQAGMSFALLVLAALVLLLLVLYRLSWTMFSLPRVWRRRHAQERQRKGYGALTLGLTAAAAGDAKLASYHAHRARAFLPDDGGLPVFLEAQAARLRGDDEAARAAYEKLLDSREAAFLGVRGLLQEAQECGDASDTGVLGARVLALYPQHPAVLKTVYDLALRRRDWPAAEDLLDRIAAHKAMEPARIRSDRIALLLQRAETAPGEAVPGLLKKALGLDPAFAPAVVRLASHYLDAGKKSRALGILRRGWGRNPHPDILRLWDDIAPPGKKLSGAENLPPAKAWVCRETGTVYSRWSPVAEPQGGFNTMVWTEPDVRQERHRSLAARRRNPVL